MGGCRVVLVLFVLFYHGPKYEPTSPREDLTRHSQSSCLARVRFQGSIVEEDHLCELTGSKLGQMPWQFEHCVHELNRKNRVGHDTAS